MLGGAFFLSPPVRAALTFELSGLSDAAALDGAHRTLSRRADRVRAMRRGNVSFFPPRGLFPSHTEPCVSVQMLANDKTLRGHMKRHEAEDAEEEHTCEEPGCEKVRSRPSLAIHSPLTLENTSRRLSRTRCSWRSTRGCTRFRLFASTKGAGRCVKFRWPFFPLSETDTPR